ncbi:NAD(P)-dependent dehydrogenase, short-chain alcohol dehydrogenase family [Nonomuraea jiangxiensis]|uniref:NAD(P)-dependent dehydrogenase, short-chain alcohol dehydrogenase family n=1 Tax=Nonomuraea jiangxiensis TaxID=633440 RepID=A0A1G8URK8_9ACTN|nr:NAD(P)-dependent dehydrogenase, short-chain alcohol dehydrogenase family [Nonomuraea jiangxiensis]
MIRHRLTTDNGERGVDIVRIDLSGKTALVTASTQGIGAAIATGLAQAGASVGINGRSVGSVTAAMEKMGTGTEGALLAAPGDVTTDEGLAQVTQALPHLDILVNNLGLYEARPALEIDDAEWRRYFETNVLSAVRLTRAYLPGMIDQDWGRILYIASDSSVAIPAEMIHYGMTKTALLAVSRGFAKAAAGGGVTVNSVLAGATHTAGIEEFVYQLVDKQLPWEEAQRAFMREHRPLSLIQRLIEPEEIANMVVYLSSPLASATTGGALRVDGGYVDSILP